MAALRSKTGLLNYRDGSVEPARFYYGADETEPQNHTRVDPENHATWVEDDGAVGIRRGTSVSVGASPVYSKNYDTVDWGN
jgi:hypothetical protein